MDDAESIAGSRPPAPSAAATRNILHQTIAPALLPWPAVALGLYVFRSAWAAFALYHAVCLLSWLACKPQLPEIAKSLVRFRRRHWAAFVIACLTLNTVVYFGASYVSALVAPHHLSNALAQLGIGSSLEARAALFCYFGLVNPVVEELFWRRTIYARFRAAGWNSRRAALVSGAFFGAWHWLPVHVLLPRGIVIVSVIGIAATGVLLAQVFERLRSMRVVMLLHALGADVPILITLWVDVLSRK